MRRPEEVQVVFKDCQTRTAKIRTAKIRIRQKRTGTAEGQWRRAMAKGTVEGHSRRAMKKEMKKERGRTMEKGNGEEQ